MDVIIEHEPRRMREKVVYGDQGFTVIKFPDGKIRDIVFYIDIRIDFPLFDEFEYGQRRKGFCQGADHEIGVFCDANFLPGIPVPIASREDHPAFMHQGDSGAGDPMLLQVISDEGIESGGRPLKISLLEGRSIRLQGTAAQGK
jgi:hypothetical protein